MYIHMSLDTWRENCTDRYNPQSKLDETVVDLSEDWNFWKMESSTSKINMNKSQDCPICDYRCKTKSSLKDHIDAIHEEKKPHKCSICDYSCKSESNLKRHIDAIHEGKKPHECSICDYSCATKAHLKHHIDAVHEGKKPYKCSICDYNCATK